jgi:hypothetical protein
MPIYTGRFKRESCSVQVTPGASVTTATLVDTLNGLLREVIITPPAAVDGSATMIFTLVDLDGNVVYTKSGLAAGAATSINLLTNDLRVPLSGKYTLTVTYSANQTTTASSTKVVLYIET